MSTKANIIAKLDGKFHVNYVHYDGYPDHMLPTLALYKTEEQIRELFALGGIQFLGNSVAECPRLINPEPTIFLNTLDEICDSEDLSHIEYQYVWEDGEWTELI